ncbi:MAG: LysM peptidoglycan-binding domain-containing protein [candidate division NC10 bacterium]|nr:LysM peptidoglycan-binding domain-containing protein [candidate division NC10 bacterium]
MACFSKWFLPLGIGLFLTISPLLAVEEAKPPSSPAQLPPGEEEKGKPAQSEEIYNVRKGDTLWDISKTLLKDPFLWRQIWEKNKYITNPHRIYPGDPLIIPGLVAPSPIEKREAPQVEVPPEVGPRPAELQPAEAPKLAEEAPKAAEKPEAKVETKLELPQPLPIPVASQESIVCSGFIAEGVALPGSGAILKALVDKNALAWGDIVFITPGDVSAKVGDRFAIYREGERVRHPKTRQVLGTQIRSLGRLEVIEVEGGSIRTRIIYSCEDIRVGDRLLPDRAVAFPYSKVPKPTTAQVEGYIVGAQERALGLAERQIVFIDQGSQVGVAPGDVFSVYREGGKVEGPPAKGEVTLSRTILGELMVLRVGERTATAIITRSTEEFLVGDRVFLSKKITD